MKLSAQFVLLASLSLFAFVPRADAQSSPKLYPNAKLKSLPSGQLNQIIATCESEAKGAVGVGNEKGGKKTLRRAAKGAGLGALAGTITNQNAGRSAGAGAAVAGTAAVLDNAKARREGSPEYRSYVSACLEDQGLKVVGWE